MADDIFLTGPLGTQWNIGSWVEKSAGVDFGAAQLVRQIYGQNAWAEGARLGFETAAGPREMTFPLIVPSGGVPFLSLDTIEASLRQMVRPGGFVDLKLDGVPTAEMVRFDVIGGDVAHRNYTVDVQRIDRRRYTLSLDTQPFGYWPTWITLASAASVGMGGNGKLALGAPSPLGDIPGLLELMIVPTSGSQTASGFAYFADGLAWANGARPSFVAGHGGGSWNGINTTASYIALDNRAFATGAVFSVPPATGWSALAAYTVASSLEPAYRGRFRAFGVFFDGGARPHQFSIDTQPAGLNNVAALASANQVATLMPTAGAYQILDLGEITVPNLGSGIQQGHLLRVWIGAGSAAATSAMIFNGVYLQPLGGGAGIISRGLVQPTVGTWIGAATSNLQLTGALLRQDVGALAMPLGGSHVYANLARFYRGGMPQYGATVQQLDLMRFNRRMGDGSAAVDTFAANHDWAAVSVRYRPRFQFLKSI